MAEQPQSTIAPIPPSSSPVLDRFYDYLNQPLRTEDPLKNLLSNVAEFVPGISTELARRRGDTMGEALSYLDVLGGAGTGVKLGSIFLIERKKMLEKAIKDLDSDPILKMNPDAGKTLQKQLDEVNQQIATDKETAKRYGEITDEILGGGKSSIPTSPFVTKFSDDRAALLKELEKAEEKMYSLQYSKEKPKVDGKKLTDAIRERSRLLLKLDVMDKNRAGFINATNKTQKDIIFEIFAEGGNQARKMVKLHPELAAEYINKGNVISPVAGVDYSQLRGLEPPGFTPPKGITSQLPTTTLNQLIDAAEKQNKIMRKREGDDFVDDFFFGKKPD